MPERTIEDALRVEYFELQAEIRRVAWQMETEIRYRTLSVLHQLNPYEQLIVRSRIKDCESALQSLRRRQEGRVFDPAGNYSLSQLPDLVGVRVLVFPRARVEQVDELLKRQFPEWTPDPVRDDDGEILAAKYNGYCREVSERIRAEYQVVPMLVGLFWEVEHSAMYKPGPSLRGVENSKEMRRLRAEAEGALLRFESGFEAFVTEHS
jgi:ppGpp synthetase/RelA/SpoT-type nucleotidyltranferase